MKGTSSLTCTASERSNQPESLRLFDFAPLGRVLFGSGTLERLGEQARELGGTRALLVTDPGLLQAGHPERARATLEAAGVAVTMFDGVAENPTEQHVDAAVLIARTAGIDLIVAVGGGSSMDCAKGANFILTNGGRMADYRGIGKAKKPMLPSIGVPTTAGTGSEAQSFALITDERSHIKMACGDRKAAFRVSILDPEVTLSQPTNVTAITGIDALAHAVESYVCTKRNAISQMCARTAYRKIDAHLPIVLEEPENLNARAEMQIGSHLAGMAIENSMLGICHSCANPVTAHYGLTHGTVIGILLPHVIRFNALVAGPMYAELASECGMLNGEPGSEVIAHRVSEVMRMAKLPTSLSEVGVSREILPLLAEEAAEQWTAQFNPRPVSEPELLRVYEMAW